MKIIFIDDERFISDVTWVKYPQYTDVVRIICFRELVDYLSTNVIDVANTLFSFDHDLQSFDSFRCESFVFGEMQSNIEHREYTGVDCAKYVKSLYGDVNYIVHSKNPIGAVAIEEVMKNDLNFINYNKVR